MKGTMSNLDHEMLDECTTAAIRNQIEKEIRNKWPTADGADKSLKMEHPLDEDIMEALGHLKDNVRENDDTFQIFRYREDVDKLWANLLEKAIKCLRYCDSREPFIESGKNGQQKRPLAYGIHTLREYYKKYTKFERVLYGSTHYYRDHVVHVFRVWLSGIGLLTRNGCANLQKFQINDALGVELLMVEKISMWTIIALTHDLGYPLEKARKILNATHDMIATVLSNPEISADFSFHGAQNQMNDNIVRIMSSKMILTRRAEGAKDAKSAEDAKSEKDEETPYVARLQQKYYQKFLKSLEKNHHGILSAIIIAKILKYFLETDYSLNEDYGFTHEDMRQFYIRREILRSIAAHTCDDIYLLYMGSFAFLLRICDDTQEWGRKYISELYTPAEETYTLTDIGLNFDEGTCNVGEEITQTQKDADRLISLIWRFYKQSLVYITVFRDGLDTQKRDFSFNRIQTIKNTEIEITLTLDIAKESAAKLTGTVHCLKENNTRNKIYMEKLCRKIQEDAQEGTCLYLDVNEEPLVSKSASKSKTTDFSKWRFFKFQLPLVNESGYL